MSNMRIYYKYLVLDNAVINKKMDDMNSCTSFIFDFHVIKLLK